MPKCSRFFSSHVLLILLYLFHVHVENTISEEMRSTVGIGLVLDMNSTFGTMVNMCMDMAVSDFYKAHPNHITRLQLHKKDAKSVLDVNVAGNRLSNNWSVFVLVCWLLMAFVLMQSFTANLSAILTVDQLEFDFSDDYYVGYHEGSFMKKFLTEQRHIRESRLRAYSSIEAFHDAMSRGSKKGGVDAVFDEIPYMKLFLIRYKSEYKIVGPTYTTGGMGFAFPIGSPLVAYFSRVILNVTQGSEMSSLEQKNFGPGYSSQDPLSSVISQGTSSLSLREFGGLFIITGSLIAFALVYSESEAIGHFIQNYFSSFWTPHIPPVEVGARVIEVAEDVGNIPPPGEDARLIREPEELEIIANAAQNHG